MISLIEDKNLISSDAAAEYIIQAVNFLKKSDETNFQDKLKSKYFEGTMAEKMKRLSLKNFFREF